MFLCSDPRGADVPSNDCDLKALSCCSSYLAGTLIHNISDAVDAFHTSFLSFLGHFKRLEIIVPGLLPGGSIAKEVVNYADR